MSRLLAVALIAGCSVTTAPEPEPITGEGIFREGCPVDGHATAARITDGQTRMRGSKAVSTPGDVLLMNSRAAYVITDVDKGATSTAVPSTYWYYGGAIADAAAIDGCEQTSDDLLDDIGLILGSLELTAVEASILRAFEATSVEVLADGSGGGPAIVRARGRDAMHWLVEHTLQNDDLRGDRVFGRTLGLEVEVDYVLEPDSPALRIDVRITNTMATRQRLMGAALITVDDPLRRYGSGTFDIGLPFLSLEAGIPWLTFANGEGALAFAVHGSNLGTASVSGVNVVLDVDQAVTTPIELGADGGTGSLGYWLSVGPTDAASASAGLHPVHPEPLREATLTVYPQAGVVTGPNGPVAGATVEIESQPPEEPWGVLEVFTTDAEGRWGGDLGAFDGWPLRAIVRQEGRDSSEPVAFTAGTELQLPANPAGVLELDAHDAAGEPIPVRLELTRTDGQRATRYLFGQTSTPLPPGTWDWVATRGWEWAPDSGTVTIDGTGQLTAVLERVVDTSGFMTVDTHIHSEASADSTVPRGHQLGVATAHGLEVAVATDHETIVSFEPDIDAAGLRGIIASVSGEEVTAVGLEHMTMFPTPPDGTPRGGFIQWYGLDYPELVAAQRARGAGVVMLNHPGYLGRIGWDRLAGQPTMAPDRFGLSEDASLWTWDIDGLELMNSMSNPFASGNGRFDDWMSFLNHGHRIHAAGSSDDHGGRGTGLPATFFASSTDAPGEFREDDLVTSYQQGRTMISAGAFGRVSIGDASLGDVVTDTDGAVDLALEITALPEVGITHVVVFANCDEVADLPTTDPGGLIKLSTEVRLTLDADAHVVVAVFGDGSGPLGLPSAGSTTPRLLTNPIYVDVDGNGEFDAPGGKACTYGPW